MVGILVGALTFGLATPHFFIAVGSIDRRIPVAIALPSKRGRR